MSSKYHPGLQITDYQQPQDLVADQRPSIAVVVALWSPDLSQHAARTMHDLTLLTVNELRDLGARPVVIDSSAEQRQNQGTTWHDDIDGLLYLGGADIHPGYYSDLALTAPRPGIDSAADGFCLSSLQRAVADDMPVLGICRGSQLLNVALGGTIVQHLDGHRLERSDGRTGFVDETLRLAADARIAQLLGSTTVTVRGSHHQAIDAIGSGLRATAWAADNTIEGVEHTRRSWVVGVQWHPEEQRANVQDRRNIFAALIRQAAG